MILQPHMRKHCTREKFGKSRNGYHIPARYGCDPTTEVHQPTLLIAFQRLMRSTTCGRFQEGLDEFLYQVLARYGTS